MNEFLRLLRKSLRPFGYDVRKHNNYNLLPFRPVAGLAELATVKDFWDRDLNPAPAVGGNLNALKIFIRTCIRDDRNPQHANRVTQASLRETVLRCLRSTVQSANDAMQRMKGGSIEIIVLDDHSDAAYLREIERVIAGFNGPWKVETTEARGQGPSLREQFARAQGADALCYFCEDDYLHAPTAIYEMWEFYRRIHGAINSHMVLHPQESESLYGTYYPSYLLLSPTRHWRTVSHATHVLFTHGHVVDQYWEYFENTKFVGNRKKRRLGGESRTTNRLFEHMPGFVPVPALAGHLQKQETLPPFFDWQALWDANKVDAA